jgi:hypothetical protein
MNEITWDAAKRNDQIASWDSAQGGVRRRDAMTESLFVLAATTNPAAP